MIQCCNLMWLNQCDINADNLNLEVCDSEHKAKGLYPQLAIALAVFSGSMGSAGAGFLLVATAQKRQPRVQVSPSNIMVAVAMPSPSPPAPPPPFQHCATKTQTYISKCKRPIFHVELVLLHTHSSGLIPLSVLAQHLTNGSFNIILTTIKHRNKRLKWQSYMFGSHQFKVEIHVIESMCQDIVICGFNDYDINPQGINIFVTTNSISN